MKNGSSNKKTAQDEKNHYRLMPKTRKEIEYVIEKITPSQVRKIQKTKGPEVIGQHQKSSKTPQKIQVYFALIYHFVSNARAIDSRMPLAAKGGVKRAILFLDAREYFFIFWGGWKMSFRFEAKVVESPTGKT